MRASIWDIVTYAELLRSAYAALAAGDADGFLAHCARDMDRTTVPPATGRHYAIRDILTSDDGGIVRVRCTVTRDGRPHGYDTMHLYEIRNGELASFREILED
jgi:ketosteroid isomerase-like protein